jgi:hypothetical protein
MSKTEIMVGYIILSIVAGVLCARWGASPLDTFLLSCGIGVIWFSLARR